MDKFKYFKLTTQLSICRDKIIFHLYHNNVDSLLYWYDKYIELGGLPENLNYK